MNEEFLAALKRIQNGDQKTVFADVHHLFTAINSMDPSTAMSAYQTLRFFGAPHTIEDPGLKRRVEMIEEAIITRMKALVFECSSDDREKVAYVFASAMGGADRMWRFKRIIGSNEVSVR